MSTKKLTPAQERNIARLVTVQNKTKAEVARQYNVSPRTVGRIVDSINPKPKEKAQSAAPAPVKKSPVQRVSASSEKKEQYAVVATHQNITVFHGSASAIVQSTDPDYPVYMSRLVNEGQSQELLEEIFKNNNLASKIEAFEMDGVFVDAETGTVAFDGIRVSPNLGNRIVDAVKSGKKSEIEKLIRFCSHLHKNPSRTAVSGLFDFLMANDIEIDEDGMVICFKRVRSDYKDVYSGRYDNSPGRTVKMHRFQVDEDPNNTCSQGLHVCSKHYLRSYSGDVIVRCRVNPANFVAVPTDYNRAKARVCAYYVIDDVTATLEY